MKNDIKTLQENLGFMRHELELMPEGSILGRLCIQSIINHYEKKIESLQKSTTQTPNKMCR